MRKLWISFALLAASAACASAQTMPGPAAVPGPPAASEPTPMPSPGEILSTGEIPVMELPQKLPVVLNWEPGVGDYGGMVSLEQAANERLARHVYLERVLDQGEAIDVKWHVEPLGDWPAMPSLFQGDTYPEGVLHIAPGQRRADVVIHTVETGKPDWRREFRVVLDDADTGKPILGPYMLPIVVDFEVSGDLLCAPGRPDLCDKYDDDEDGNAGAAKPAESARSGGKPE